MYGISKLAECCYTRILAKDLEPRRVMVNAVCPGEEPLQPCKGAPLLRSAAAAAVAGAASRAGTVPLMLAAIHLPPACADSLLPPTRPSACLLPCLPAGWCSTSMSSFKAPRSAAEGADTPVWLAFLPDSKFVTGQFFKDRKAEPW